MKKGKRKKKKAYQVHCYMPGLTVCDIADKIAF